MWLSSKSGAVILNQLVGALSSQIGDESWVVRKLCVKGLVEVSGGHLFLLCSKLECVAASDFVSSFCRFQGRKCQITQLKFLV